jgi:hypothetical protein
MQDRYSGYALPNLALSCLTAVVLTEAINMKIDSAVRDLQQEKSALEAILSPNTPWESRETEREIIAIDRLTWQATAPKTAPTIQPVDKPAGL